MSETGELWRDVREARMGEGIERRAAADDDFPAAVRRCASRGLTLRRHGEAHYGLEHDRDGWLINIYPGNRRIYMDPNRPRAPYLDLPRDWSLEEVISSAITKAKGVS